MAIALALLALTYAALWFGVFELWRAYPSARPYWVIVAVALAIAMVGHYRDGGKVLLASVGAKVVEPGEEPELEGMLHRLAGLADIPAPGWRSPTPTRPTRSRSA